MAITNSFAKFIFYLKKNGADFTKVLTLGRLRLYTNPEILNEYAKAGGLQLDFDTTRNEDYSEDFFKILGAKQADSMDYSDYENASIIHDLNLPLPQSLYNKYSVVLDSGTLEHVFNFPTAIKSCMQALILGGTYIAVTPANNMMGHGFYQFSPELFYRIFSNENGFKVKTMLVAVVDNNGDVEKWYEVKDPSDVRSRVTLRNFKETYLFIAAEKIAETPILKSSPFQSDYVAAWDRGSDSGNVNQPAAKKIYKQIVPKKGQDFIRKAKNLFFPSKKFNDDSIGIIDPAHFKEINL